MEGLRTNKVSSFMEGLRTGLFPLFPEKASELAL